MSLHVLPEAIEYPETDGLPMAENMLQFDWISKLVAGLRSLFRDRDDVLVAGDLFWYPVERDNVTRVAPDAMVVFGRPKHRRRSYMQWREEGIGPQVVFEVLSPSNDADEMTRKLAFYDRFGVDEYYVIDPEPNHLEAWMRVDGVLAPVDVNSGWLSPRLGVRFTWIDSELELLDPSGEPFKFVDQAISEAKDQQQRAEVERRLAEFERRRAEAAEQSAEAASLRAETEAHRAKAESERAEQERLRADEALRMAGEERARNERLLEKLRALGVEAED